MPLGEIAGEAIGGIARVVGRFLVEIVFEVLFKGCGYLVLGTLRPRSQPSEFACGMVGLVLWATVIALGVWLYRHLTAA